MQDDQNPFDLKRLALFFVLSMGIFYAWSYFAPKPPKPPVPVAGETAPAAAPGTTAPGMAAPAATTPADASSPAAVSATDAPMAPAPPPALQAEAGARRVTASTSRWQVELSNVGGRLTSWRLPEHKEYGDATRPIDLVRRRNDAAILDANGLPTAADTQDMLPLQVVSGDAVVDQKLATALHVLDVTSAAGTTTLTARYSDGAGLSVEKILTLREDPPIATLEARLFVGGQPRAFSLAWGPGFGNHTLADQRNSYFRRGSIAWRAGAKVKVAERPDKAAELAPSTVDWAAIEDSFFAVIVVPAAPVVAPSQSAFLAQGFNATGQLRPNADGKTKKRDWPDELTLLIPFGPQAPQQSLYVGPRERLVLQGLNAAFLGDRDFASLLQMGLLQPIAVTMHRILIWFHAHTSSWGLSIVLLTLLIRALMFPLTHMSLKKMRGMQDKMKIVKPKEKAIQERFRKLPRNSENKLREHQERMALYQEVGIGPAETLSGCLPLLVSIPFFWALFQLLPNAAEFRHEPFLRLWSDLSTADPYHVWPIATAVTMFVSSWMSMSSAPATDPLQRNMLLVMPLMFGWICWGAPLGLVVYWTINNLVQLAQQYLLNLTMPPTDSQATSASTRRAARKKT